MRIALATLGALLALARPVAAQPADQLVARGRELLHAGYHAADVGRLNQARTLFLRATGDAHLGSLAHYYVGLTGSRLANLTEDDGRALTYVEEAIEHLEAAVEADERSAEAHALLSSLYGRKVGLRPMQGMLLGPRASSELDRAKALAPDNPRVAYIEAMSLFHRPQMWGGDPEQARRTLERAIELFERERPQGPLAPDWGHAEALAWLGIMYARADQLGRARAAFERALAVEPGFVWVRGTLLPQLAQREARGR